MKDTIKEAFVNRRRTLAGRLALWLSVIVTGVIALLGFVYFFITINQAQNALTQQATRRVEELANVLSIPTWNLDVVAVKQIAISYQVVENVAAIRVFDDIGGILYESVSNEDGLIVETRPVMFNSKKVGLVELSISTRQIAQLRRDILFQSLVVAAVVVATILIATWLLLQNFLGAPLAVLTKGIRGFADGNYSLRLKPLAQDELNDIVEQFNAMADQIQADNQVLEQRVTERTAVAENARAESESARKDIEAQIWLATGQTQLADAMRGELDVRQLAESVISQICQYTGAQAGALFVLDKKTLTLVGRYAYADRPGFEGSFNLGEGLVGQAAADGKVMYLADIPSDMAMISTGLADVKPRQVAAAPFYANGEVVGVIELATLAQFTQTHLELWNRTSESIGAAFRTAQTRQRLAELLLESQQQAEELQTQEEELRAANEELHAQAERTKIK
jgi:methyl-accepting chemotaxis protein